MIYIQQITEYIQKDHIVDAINLFITHENKYTIFNGIGIKLKKRLNQAINDYHANQISLERKSIIKSRISKELLEMIGFIEQYQVLKDGLWNHCDLSNYKNTCLQLYNTIKIIGLHKPIDLQSIFVKLNTIKPKELTYKTTLSVTNNNISEIDFTDKTNKYILLGKPGSGKTTYLNSILLEHLENQSYRLPIFINLKLWSESNQDLFDYIEQRYCDFAKTKDSNLFKQLLFDGYCLILLDGLDEVSNTDRAKVITGIKEFTISYASNAVVVTCRMGAYSYSFNQFSDVEIDNFTLNQIEFFINNYFKDAPLKAIECIKEIQVDKKLQDLACTPILLSLLCVLYDSGFPLFSQNKLELYEKAINVLLKKIDKAKPLNRISADNQSYHFHKNDILRYIAFQMFTTEQVTIEKQNLTNLIKLCLKESIEEYKLQEESEILIQLFIIQGILTIKANNRYSFNHLIFQEFFAAKYIIEHENAFSKKNLIAKYATNGRWKEIFLLTTSLLILSEDSLLISSDAFFNDFIQHNYTYFQQSKKFKLLVDLLSVYHANEAASNYQVIYKIINLSNIIGNHSTKNEHHFFLKTKLDNIAFSIFKILKLNNSNDFKQIEQDADKILNSNKLPKHLVNLEDKDLDVIENYIISIHRMLQCLDIATISDTVRQTVITSVLNLPSALKPSVYNPKYWLYLLQR